MPPYTIGGLEVHFPYEAYPCQIEYMSKVIEGLDKGMNVLLESPTGTGKTLCLLCGVLGWVVGQKGKKGDVPKVYYSSRTHSQLKQVVKEFKRTEYGKGNHGGITMTVLGSRDQLCIHPRAEGSSFTSKNAICSSLRQNRKCRFYNKLDAFLENGGLAKIQEDANEKNASNSAKPPALHDIEELTSLGATHGFCPFYYSRKMMTNVDIIFAPYNYLIDPRLRKQIGIDLTNTILIVDEAHNIASNTTDSSSYCLNTVNITEAVNELSRARVSVTQDSEIPAQDASTRIKDYDLLSGILKKLAHSIEMTLLKAPPNPKSGDPHIVSPGGDVLGFLKEQTSLTSETLPEFMRVIEQAVADVAQTAVSSGVRADTPGLEKLQAFLTGVYSERKETLDECFRMVLFRERPDKKHKKHNVQPPTQLGVWCMDASVAMRSMLQTKEGAQIPRSLLITSGTLRPLDFFAAELGVEFPVKLQNPHVISESQIMTVAVRSGDNNALLNSRFANRTNPLYIRALGVSLAKIVGLVPHGLLVFFQSFTFMKDMLDAWKKPNTYDEGHSIFDVINNRKFIIEEPMVASMTAAKIKEYCSIIDEGNGAVMFAVFRGKMAEGMDFPDRYARGVALVGIPYANIGELKVSLKMQYLDETKAVRKGSVSGSNWYTLDALRSINQAVGRVIRHSKDYGAVFFLDERYDSKGLQVQLPPWVGHNMTTVQKVDDNFINNIRGFYNRNGLASVGRTGATGFAKRQKVELVNDDGVGRKRSLEDDKATEDAFKHARRYQELRESQHPSIKKARVEQGIPTSSTVFTAGDLTASTQPAPVPSSQPAAVNIGAVDYAAAYTLQEYKKAVKAALSPEQYDTWKALLIEFAQQIDTATVFMRDRFIPWIVTAFTLKNLTLLRCHVVTLPPSLRKGYLLLLREHLKVVRLGGVA